MLLATEHASRAETPKSNLSTMMQTPLILGASISNDKFTASPGRTLALRYTTSDKIKKIAFNGTPGVKTLQSFSKKDLKDRSAVIAIDLFFWDSVSANAGPSILALQKLVDQTSNAKLPLVLGEVPELIPGYQPSAKILNREISRLCQKNRNCYLMPLKEIHQEVISAGALEIKGKKYPLSELIPDGLHLSSLAGEELAERLAILLQK